MFAEKNASGGSRKNTMGAPMSSFKVDESWKAFVTQSDGTAVSFWIISIAMIAATAFFFT